MQPYQAASEESIRQGELPYQALKTAAPIALSAASATAGGLAFKKVLPFLSEYIPQDLAIKGLSKIDPRFGKFINTALGAGKSFGEIRDFIKEKAEEGKPAQNLNPIQQHSDELYSFLEGHIKNGRSALEAGALAELSDKFKKPIAEIVKNNKAPWSSIVETVFGNNSNANQAAPQQPPQKQSGAMSELMQALQMAAQSRQKRAK